MIERDSSPNQDNKDAPNSMDAFKALVDANPQSAFLCTALKADNPNYLVIIRANQAFCQNFNISQEDLIGKSYDFLFDNIDINYASEDQLEYIRLIIVSCIRNSENDVG